jgi:DNA-binding SARP family transcriptional activator/predicted ATPase
LAHLSLSLLGPFHATLDGDPIVGFESNKARALLAYLAVEAGRMHHREHLADLLWPAFPGRGALSNLRYTLSNLRQAIGDRQARPPYLIVTRDTILFNVDSDYSLDVATFRELVEPKAAGPQEIDRLERALALYRGSFLEGFSVRDSFPFEEWALFKREEIGRQVMAALHRLATIYEQRGQYEQAIAHARHQLELEPWQEEAHRHLMRLLALSGQRSTALAQYNICRSQLAEELGVEPTAETTALYESIRSGMLSEKPGPLGTRPAGGPASIRPASPRVPPPPFVAREQELARLNQLLDTVLAGQGQVVFVTGEAGSGKTALMHEFSRQAMAAHGNVVVATGNCTAHAGAGDPYLPFMDVLHMLAGDIEAKRASGAIAPEHARRLWSLLPQTVDALLEVGPDLIDLLVPAKTLAARVATYAPWPGGAAAGAVQQARLEEIVKQRAASPTGTVAIARGGLFAQVTRVLQTIAHQQTLILVLDDLQWVDSGSVDLLFHLGRRLSGCRILVLGAYRPGTVALGRNRERHPLEFLVNEFQREFGNMPVDLAQADGQRFVEAFVDAEPNRLGAAFRDTLYRHTRGQALFTVELVRGLQKRGDLVQDGAGVWIEGRSLNWARMPVRVEAVIAERIDRLPPECRTMLDVASVEGEEFTAEVVARVLGVTEEEVLRRLSGELSKQHDLVRPQSLQRLAPGSSSDPSRGGQRLSRYRFRHYLFQLYLYQHLDPVERAALHETIGRSLEALYHGHEAGREAIAPQLAQHFEAAGLADRAVDCLIEAGRWAFRLSATQEAITYYRRGLALLGAEPDWSNVEYSGTQERRAERDRRELDLQLALSDPLVATRGWGATEQASALMRAYQLAERLGEIDRLLPVLLSVANMSIGQGEFYKALDLSDELLHLAEQIGEPFYIAMSHHRLGSSYLFLGELALAREHLEQALALYRRQPPGSPFPPSIWTIEVGIPTLARLPHLLWMLGYPDQALACSQEALAVARDLNHIPTLAAALSGACSSFYLLRRQAPIARQYTTALLRLAAEQDLVTFEILETIHDGYEQVEAGQIEAGIETMRHGLASLEGRDQVATRPRQLVLLAEACLKAGQVAAGLDAVDEAQALADRTGARASQPEIYRLRGQLLLQAADGNAPAPDTGCHADISAPEACFRQAIDVARLQQGRSWELRAIMSLCRLLQAQGQCQVAREKLAELYAWFAEGFDTPDLQEACALLQELGTG